MREGTAESLGPRGTKPWVLVLAAVKDPHLEDVTNAPPVTSECPTQLIEDTLGAVVACRRADGRAHELFHRS
jgi:hypothetical protein